MICKECREEIVEAIEVMEKYMPLESSLPIKGRLLKVGYWGLGFNEALGKVLDIIGYK